MNHSLQNGGCTNLTCSYQNGIQAPSHYHKPHPLITASMHFFQTAQVGIHLHMFHRLKQTRHGPIIDLSIRRCRGQFGCCNGSPAPPPAPLVHQLTIMPPINVLLLYTCPKLATCGIESVKWDIPCRIHVRGGLAWRGCILQQCHHWGFSRNWFG